MFCINIHKEDSKKNLCENNLLFRFSSQDLALGFEIKFTLKYSKITFFKHILIHFKLVSTFIVDTPK